MPDLGELTPEDFDPLRGSSFAVAAVDDPGAVVTELRLVDVVRLGPPPAPGLRAPFSLRFQGPPAPVLAHDVHRLVHPVLGELDVFLGPVVSASEPVSYEAVFA